MFGETEVTYWIGKEYWGKGVATSALQLFLKEYKERPLYARAAKDNIGSIKVLEKCEFKKIKDEVGFANARNADIEESVFILN